MPRLRADALLVLRGLVESRAKAQEAIAAGGVVIDGAPVIKPSALVAEDAAVDFTPAHPYVSRGGVKLAFALEAFGVDPAGRDALDLGASTGGFTDVLLRAGARSVLAIDVGHGQLRPAIAADPRVRAIEGLDARALTAAQLIAPPSLIVADLSFIGLAKAIGPALALAAPEATLIALIKPQFEAGPEAIGKGGRVADEAAESIARAAADGLDQLHGFQRKAFVESPIRGGAGAREFLAHFARG